MSVGGTQTSLNVLLSLTQPRISARHLGLGESDLAAGAHLRFCSLAFLLCSFRNQEKHTSPISFSYFEEVKKGGEREGERERERERTRARERARANVRNNWQKTLQENEFDRFVQFWISVFLFPESVRKAKALPPR